jgi:hypothetical protein
MNIDAVIWFSYRKFRYMTEIEFQKNFSQLQYHLYTSPLPHVSNLHPHQKTIHAFFMLDQLREELQRKNEATLKTVNGIVTMIYYYLVI